jgi:hypothetical protein
MKREKLEGKVDLINRYTGGNFSLNYDRYNCGYFLTERGGGCTTENDRMNSNEMYAYLRGVLAGLKLK